MYPNTIPERMKPFVLFVFLLFISFFKTYSQSSFTTPDTVCVNEPVKITNTSAGATNYYWNFCVADANIAPEGTNL